MDIYDFNFLAFASMPKKNEREKTHGRYTKYFFLYKMIIYKNETLSTRKNPDNLFHG